MTSALSNTHQQPKRYSAVAIALPIKRLAFKIGEGDRADTSMVADDVQVRFELTLSGVGKL